MPPLTGSSINIFKNWRSEIVIRKQDVNTDEIFKDNDHYFLNWS